MRSPSRFPHAQALLPADWCLFLDRDGVINKRNFDGYVQTWNDFVFLPGVLEAMAILAEVAPRIVIVTNQQGVGKGLMSAADLADIHERMQSAVSDRGGRIDAIEFCPHLAGAGCDCRKPRPGMPLRYLRAHPQVDGSRSVMVGDTASDIEMGRRLGAVTGGCRTVRIAPQPDPLADETFPDLLEFATALSAEGTIRGHSAE